MDDIPQSLAITAVTVGFIHTIIGPDHYVPFVAMSRAGGWTARRTLIVTLLCGVGHVLSSVILGFIGIALGIGLNRLEGIENARGNLAGWLLIAFGLVYFVWGIRAAIRNRPHSHFHAHADGTVHAHQHTHDATHAHVHEAAKNETRQPSMTPWVLFTIFVFGPCEALIPMLMFPAAEGSMWGVAYVTLLFGATTLATMTAIVMAMLYGVRSLRLAVLARFGHAAAGAVVLCCGIAVKFGL